MRKWMGIACLLIVVTALFSAAIVGADTLNYDPTGDNGDWTNGSNAYSSDNTYATSNLPNDVHYWTDYGMTGDGVVDSVEFGVEYYQEGPGVPDNVIFRVTWDGGGSWGAPHVPAPGPPVDPDTVEWFNATGDTSWTWDTLSDSNFQITASNSCLMEPCGTTQYLDYIPVRIYWTPNNEPEISGTDDYDQVTVGNFHDRLFTASDPNSDALTWTLTTDCSELSLWQDNWTAGVQGVPKTIGDYYVNLTVADTWDSDFLNYSLKVVTEDITSCRNCYVSGELRYTRFLNAYRFELNVTKTVAVIRQYVWHFGDGTTATTTDPYVEHTFWVGAFTKEDVTVSVQVLTSSGAARPIDREVTVDNSWQLWILLIGLGLGSYLSMRYVSRVYARTRAESE